MADQQRYATESRPGAPLPSIALALSLLVAPAGIVLGIIALRRVERDNGRGARTAVAAIVVGAVVTLAYAVLIVLLIVLLVQLNHQPVPPGLSRP